MASGKKGALLVSAWMMLGMAAVAALPSCKTLAPEIVEDAAREGCWYSYMPESAPGFCLRTRHAMVWHDPELDLGYWQGLQAKPPHRVYMEARGTTFILHRHYVWDGNSIGHTSREDLLPSLRHDALYHALKEGAPISRRGIDNAYRRDQIAVSGRYSLPAFWALRLFGGFYNKKEPDAAPTLLIRMTTPDTPPAPFEEDVVENNPLQNLLPREKDAANKR